jgi:ribosomal protein S18 acetylase RimI-like enzyme
MRGEIAFHLRPAKPGDLEFAERLYLATMEPLMTALGEWNAGTFRGRFRAAFKAEDVRIIRVDGEDAGFIQVKNTDTDLNLAQIHLVESARNRGIGSKLIQALLTRARRERKTLSLSCPRNNPAIALYERLGFRIVKDNASNIVGMLWNSPAGMRRPDRDAQ